MAVCRFPERLAKMRDMYERGKTLEEVGEQFNLTGQTVWQTFKRYDIPTRPQPRKGRPTKAAQQARIQRQLESM